MFNGLRIEVATPLKVCAWALWRSNNARPDEPVRTGIAAVDDEIYSENKCPQTFSKLALTCNIYLIKAVQTRNPKPATRNPKLPL